MLDTLAAPDTLENRGLLVLPVGEIRMLMGLPITSSAV